MDNREREAWRDWLADRSPEAAVRWACEHERAVGRPDGTTLLREVGFDDLDQRVKNAIEQAVDVYIHDTVERACVQDLYWLTECHFWQLEEKPSPSVMRGIAAFFANAGGKLEAGDEASAEEDYNRARERGKTAQALRRRIRELESQADNLKRQLKESEEQADQYLRSYKRASEDVRRLESLCTSAKKESLENAGLQATNAILKAENERLMKVIQGRVAANG